MNKEKIKDKYLTLDEETNAIDYLENAYEFIKKAEYNNWAWKWAILSFYGSLYSFSIICLSGSDSSNRVLYKTTNGKEKLISFKEAIKRCQDPKWMTMTSLSEVLKLSDKQKESIRRLNERYRNVFVHYQPMSFIIEIHEMPNIVLDVLEVIEFLSLKTGNYIYLENKNEKKIKSLIFDCKKVIKQSNLYKEHKIFITKK